MSSGRGVSNKANRAPGVEKMPMARAETSDVEGKIPTRTGIEDVQRTAEGRAEPPDADAVGHARREAIDVEKIGQARAEATDRGPTMRPLRPEPFDEASTLPARMLNEYTYCPRLFYLEHVQGDWRESADTLDGRFQHRRVDAKDEVLAAPSEEDDPRLEHARSVYLSDPGLRLVAKIDVVEAEGEVATPLDYKRGAAPDLIEGAWEPDRVQVCAQGLLLQAHGFRSHYGFVYYVTSKKRVRVNFDVPLVERTLELRDAALRAMREPKPPPPLIDSPKCVRCSLAPICLPDETNILAGRADDEPRRLVPSRDDALPLYVQAQGGTIGVTGECLSVKYGRDGRDKEEIRLIDVSDVAVFGAVSVTTPALRTLTQRGIAVSYFSHGGWFYGMTVGLHHKNVLLRQAQYEHARDAERSLSIARRIVATKIRNQRTLLRRNATDVTETTLRELAAWARRAEHATALDELLGFEGYAARLYFGSFPAMLKGPLAEVPDLFTGRNRRPPRDPVNALLSFAYAVLTKDFTVTLQAMGFDPMLGFYHQVKYGKPALALDLMEEFRPLVADSAVITCINNGAIDRGDFVTGATGCALSEKGRKTLLEAYARRLDELVTHPVFGYRISYRRVFEVQARLLARYLMGEVPEPPSFRTR